MAGLRLSWGIEIDPEVAAVANANLGGHVLTADILEIDPHTMRRVDLLHASPPCINFSQAKPKNQESDHDMDLARQIARFVGVLRPAVFTLENVWAYRKSESWAIIRDALYRCGYWFDMAHINAADFGVPQTRRRMIVRARRGAMVPHLPVHERWVGWYEAIEDLLPLLPDAELAPWQLERLNGPLKQTVMLAQGTFRSDDGGQSPLLARRGYEPAYTVTANINMNSTRACLVTGQTPDPVARIVKLNVRCLARFQTFPDWYELPEDKTLAVRIIGNAVPCILAEKLVRQLTEAA